jgi:hypothetical protein
MQRGNTSASINGAAAYLLALVNIASEYCNCRASNPDGTSLS